MPSLKQPLLPCCPCANNTWCPDGLTKTTDLNSDCSKSQSRSTMGHAVTSACSSTSLRSLSMRFTDLTLFLLGAPSGQCSLQHGRQYSPQPLHELMCSRGVPDATPCAWPASLRSGLAMDSYQGPCGHPTQSAELLASPNQLHCSFACKMTEAAFGSDALAP